MPTAVVIAAEHAALVERVAKLEKQLARQHESEWIRAADFPGGARRARRLRESGRIIGYHLAGCGRSWYFRASDIDALMQPAAPPEKPAAEPRECVDGGEWAEANLRLLAGGTR